MGGKLVEMGAESRKRVYGLITIIIVLCISVPVFASIELNTKNSVQAENSGTQLESTPEPSSSTPTLAPSPTPTVTTSSTPVPMPVDFTCSIGSSYSFTVKVAVDLNDGMNRAEALLVADAVFSHEMKSSQYIVKSAEANNLGIWNVDLSWGAIFPDGQQESLTHFFDVIINPQNQTATYARCE